LYWHDESNEPTKEGPLSLSPQSHSPQFSTVSRGHPSLVSLVTTCQAPNIGSYEKKNLETFSFYIWKFRRDQVQSHMRVQISCGDVDWYRYLVQYEKPFFRCDFPPDPSEPLFFWQCSNCSDMASQAHHILYSKDQRTIFT
jgi:hypothetical protein